MKSSSQEKKKEKPKKQKNPSHFFFLSELTWARGLLSIADFTCALDRCV
jgi:hypothetical protein